MIWEVVSRTFTTVSAPNSEAWALMRSRAWVRASASMDEYDLISPPTMDLRPAAMSLPMCLARTVEPIATPCEATTWRPGTPSVVETSMVTPSCR